jgi:hypothetical protein
MTLLWATYTTIAETSGLPLPKLPLPWAIVVLLIGILLLVLEGSYGRLQRLPIKAEQWHELAEHFRQVGETGTWVISSREEGQEFATWVFHGEKTQQLEALCRQAGNMLVRSPRTLACVTQVIPEELNPTYRWFLFLKERFGLAEEKTGTHTNGDVTKQIYGIVLKAPVELCIHGCLDCAANEA